MPFQRDPWHLLKIPLVSWDKRTHSTASYRVLPPQHQPRGDISERAIVVSSRCSKMVNLVSTWMYYHTLSHTNVMCVLSHTTGTQFSFCLLVCRAGLPQHQLSDSKVRRDFTEITSYINEALTTGAKPISTNLWLLLWGIDHLSTGSAGISSLSPSQQFLLPWASLLSETNPSPSAF